MWHTESGDEFLSENYNKGGITTREIAAQFGVTQASVMRRARKLGLTKTVRETNIARAMKAAERKAAAPKRQPATPSRGMLPSLAVEAIQPSAKPATPQRSKPKLFAGYIAPGGASPYKTCQWIDGTPSGARCGCATVPFKSWCPEHYERVFYRPGKQTPAKEAA